MTSQLKLFGGLILFLLILALIYLLTFVVFNFGSQEKSVLKINGQEIKVEIADNPFLQARGLAGRESLGDNEGMLFVFDKPAIQRFWMKGMKFPLDIIWIKKGMIVGFEENVLPEPEVRAKDLKIYFSPEPVENVLEMKAGSVQKLGIKIGDKVEF